MQDRYVPDLGDFSKFGAIDQLCRPGRTGCLRTALLWCLNEPSKAELKKQDGRHRDYLCLDGEAGARFRDCAPHIYDTLRRIHEKQAYHVAAYPAHGLFDGSVAYFDKLLGCANNKASDRVTRRASWLKDAIEFVKDIEVVVLDPDNGLSTAAFGPGMQGAAKYVTPEECASLFDIERRSLILYQHAHRGGPFSAQIDAALSRLSKALALPREVCFALKFRTVSARAYLVMPAKPHHKLLRCRAESMVSGPWGRNGHFELL